MKHIIFAVLLTISGFLAYMLYYLGVFKPVVLTIVEDGPFRVLYKDHEGAYHKIVGEIESVETWAKAHGLQCHLTFGQYLDDPTVVEEVRLRSRGGCVLQKDESPSDLPNDFKETEIEKSRFVKAVFEGSPGIGPFRVYPKLQNEIKEKNLKPQGWGVIEIYEVKGPKEMTTTYLYPVL